MSAPARRILSSAMRLGLRRIENIFDPAAQALGSFGRLLPQALQHVEYVLCRDLVDRLSPDWFCVFGEGHFPLRCMFGIAPRRAHGRDIGVGTFIEGDRKSTRLNSSH